MKTKTWKTILFTVIATLVVSFIATNLSSQQRQIDYRFENVSPIGSLQFRRTMENMMGPSFTKGNRITAYQNGDQIFPPMLAAIRGAKKTINFESYIYWSGKVGQEFVDALCERAKSGVKVHVMLDWVGSQRVDDFVDQLKKAGVSVQKFHPPRWYSITRMNNRTHRKILVIDGKVGFTGGVGIADNWLGNADAEDHWRDSHYRIVGPAVGQLQAAFTDNWLATSAEVLQDETYFPEIKPDGPSEAQVFKSSPREGAASSELMYLMSLYAARKEVLIANSYFVPSDITAQAILNARKRGVKVQIIVPGPIMDSKTVQHASRAGWGDLLKAGVEIFEYQPTMYHCKFMIVDREWISVGSTNFDNRSFRLNSESNLNIIDKNFAQAEAKVFAQDLSRSKPYTLAHWENRSTLSRVLESFATLIEDQL